MATTNGSDYTLGPATYRKHANVYTKPSDMVGEGRHDSGGGYELVRSVEHDPRKPGDHKYDVYAAIHRLCAVVWCYPDDMATGEILDHLHGKDVHHTTGVEWANVGDSPNFDRPGLAVREHGRHSSITQAEMRAYAEDDRRRVQGDAPTDDDRCDGCDDPADILATSEDFDGHRCLECAKRASDGAPIEVG